MGKQDSKAVFPHFRYIMLIISIKDIAKKEQHTHAHKLLRECLKKYNINYNEETKIHKTEMGKPSLADYPEIK
ncbi:MAG: hypothetical protein IKS03_05025, partial [Ruminococcus sp.]|nr:hypothetical protein [Ruminococcus sp.]